MLRASTQQFFYEYFTVLLTVSRILDAGIYDFLVNGKWVIRVLAKWQLSAKKFIHDHTQ